MMLIINFKSILMKHAKFQRRESSKNLKKVKSKNFKGLTLSARGVKSRRIDRKEEIAIGENICG